MELTASRLPLTAQMRHRRNTTRLNRKPSHLDSMLRNMATSLILYGKIKTTESKASLVKPVVEDLITKAKKQTLPTAMRTLNAYLTDKNASKKLTRELVERYKERNSGYLRVIPLGYRTGDAAFIVQIEFI